MYQNEDIAYRFKYRLEDLNANRNGYMTIEQRQVLRQLIHQRNRLSIAGIVLIIVCCLLSYPNIVRGDFGSPLNIFGIAGAVALFLGWLSVTRWRRLRADLHKGNTQMVEGNIEIHWGNNWRSGYFAIEGLKFKLSEAELSMLSEDHYVVYFAPNTGQLLTLELLKLHLADGELVGDNSLNENVSRHIHGFDPVLGNIFDFTLKDLERNRLGSMTDAQLGTMQRQIIWKGINEFIQLSLLLSMSVALFLAILIFGKKPAGDWIMILGGCGVVFLLLIAMMFFGFRQLKLDLQERSLKMIEGKVYSPPRRTYNLSIHGEPFWISHTHFFPLYTGGTYRAYYAPRTRHIVSIERVNPTT